MTSTVGAQADKAVTDAEAKAMARAVRGKGLSVHLSSLSRKRRQADSRCPGHIPAGTAVRRAALFCRWIAIA